jgi:translocator protein
MKADLLIKLIVSIALPLAVGAVAGIFTTKAIPGWYATLNQPTFNPPNWLFGPVWTVLYVLMGISLYLIWKEPPSQIRTFAMAAFFIQLILNFSWSFLFFYFKSIGLAFGEIILLWLSILLTLILFYKIKPLATFINIPYLLWVSFATLLNAAYLKLN